MLVEIIHKQHLDLRELFMQHQETLLLARLDEALTGLVRFESCLSAHMALEEKYLFPAFTGIERKSRWAVGLYEKEHEKVKQLYETLADDLNWLSEQTLNDSAQRRNVIALLDKEKTFKGLLEHHEDREEKAMLVELDAQLPEKFLEELALAVKSAWAETIAVVGS